MTQHPVGDVFGAGSRWTGNLDIPLLLDDGFFSRETLWAKVTPELVELWLSRRTSMAAIDRDGFRRWLADPFWPLEVDRVSWTVRRDAVFVVIDGVHYRLSETDALKLRAVI